MAVPRVMGSSTPGGTVAVPTDASPRKRLKSLFVIEGEDVANAVFDILETPAKPVSKDALRKLVEEEANKIGLQLSASDIEDMIRGA